MFTLLEMVDTVKEYNAGLSKDNILSKGLSVGVDVVELSDDPLRLLLTLHYARNNGVAVTFRREELDK